MCQEQFGQQGCLTRREVGSMAMVFVLLKQVLQLFVGGNTAKPLVLPQNKKNTDINH